MLDYRTTYMVWDLTGSIDPPWLVGIAPRSFLDGTVPALQYMTVSESPGSNAHTIHNPEFIEQEDGSVIVKSQGARDKWRFTSLTLELWKKHFAAHDPNAGRYMVSDGAVQHYFWEQYVDEELWPQNPV